MSADSAPWRLIKMWCSFYVVQSLYFCLVRKERERDVGRVMPGAHSMNYLGRCLPGTSVDIRAADTCQFPERVRYALLQSAVRSSVFGRLISETGKLQNIVQTATLYFPVFRTFILHDPRLRSPDSRRSFTVYLCRRRCKFANTSLYCSFPSRIKS